MAAEALADAPRHVFYDRLNALLADAGFDRFVEAICESLKPASDHLLNIHTSADFKAPISGWF